MNSPTYSLITGAGSGIGYAFAEECARRGLHVLMVSLPGESLSQKSHELSAKYQVQVKFFECDLSEPTACDALFNFVREGNLLVNMLINNAGIGSNGAFEQFEPSFYERQIYLNTIVPVTLTRIFIPMLLAQSRSYILNVSSMGAFFPMPQKEVYNATKAFLLSFSKSLQLHLEGSSIQLSVVCPGPVDSNARLLEIHRDLKGMAKKAVMTPAEVATAAIGGLLAGKQVIIPGRLNRIMRVLNGWIPAAMKKNFMRKEMERQAALTRPGS